MALRLVLLSNHRISSIRLISNQISRSDRILHVIFKQFLKLFAYKLGSFLNNISIDIEAIQI
jgi:hypothetical protein